MLTGLKGLVAAIVGGWTMTGTVLAALERVYYQDQIIAKHPSTELRDPVRSLKQRRHIKGAFPEQWVYLASAPPAQVPPAQGP